MARIVYLATMTKPIDTTWFVNRLSERELSQRALAKLMGLDPAAVSLMFRGKRKMSMEEAAQLAALFDVTPTEMFERAGIQSKNPKRVKLLGFINGQSEVVAYGSGAHSYVDPPGDVPPETVAYQCKTAGTELDRLDGQIYFVDLTKGNPAQYLNAYCACAIKGGPTVIAQVRKGYARGTYNLVLMGSPRTIENAEIVWASPVTWTKFPL